MKSSHHAGFAILCLLSGSGWLLGQIYPGGMTFPLAGCVHFIFIGTVASAWWFRSRASLVSFKAAVILATAGAGVFALPGIATHLTNGAITQATSTALFCSISLLTLLALRLNGPGAAGSRSLLAGVIGVGGVVLLLSADLPGTTHGWLSFALLAGCCAAVAASGIWLHGLLRGLHLATAVALVSFGSAAMLAMGITEHTGIDLRILSIECIRCAVFDLPVMWLTVWLIREIPAGRLSARFILVPVVTALESYAVMRAGLDMRSVLALGAMIVGGFLVLSGDEEQASHSLHLG